MYLNLKRRQRPEDILGDEKGFTPATFVSSKERQRRRLDGESDVPLQQRPEDFMDEDDGLLGRELQARKEYGTATSGEEASLKFEGSASKRDDRQQLIPGPIPGELIVTESGDNIGRRLLRLLGWRKGHGIGTRRKLKGEDAPESVQKMFPRGEVMLAPEAIEEVPVPPSKHNAYGIGFDPHKNAPEFAAFASTKRRNEALRGRFGRHEPDGYRVSDAVDSAGCKQNGGFIGSSSSVHRTTQGFALDDSDDDVYQKHVVEYDDALVLPTMPLDSDRNYELRGRGEDSEKSVENKVKSWAKTFAENEVVADRCSARCPSDGRPPLEGFVVGSSLAFVSMVWKLPFPPPDFSAHHIFNEAHPVESELKKLRESIWGKGNESVRLRGISVARRAAMLGERVAKQPPPLPPLASRTAAYENMRAAMASRFMPASSGDSGGGRGSSFGETSASSGDPGALLPGLTIVKPKSKSLSSRGPSSSEGPATTSPSPSIPPGRPSVPTVEKPTVARQPVRSTSLWRPCPLLCKRLNVPVPEISKAVEWGRQGQEIPGTSTSSSAALTRDLLKDVRRSELGSFATSEDEVAVNLKTDSSLNPAKPMDSTTPPTTTDDKSLVDIELANRPEIDLFKSIFEAESDVESKSSENSNPPEKSNEGEAPLLFSSSPPSAKVPQWSSVAVAMKGGEETTNSTTSSDEINERRLIKDRYSSLKKKKKAKSKNSNKKHRKDGKKKKKKSSHHKHHR